MAAISITDGASTTCGSGSGIDPPPGSGAPSDAHYVTTQAETGLSDEFSLGTLAAGILRQTVSSGVATLSVIPDAGITTGHVLTWNGSAWGPAASAAGDIDGVTAGTGLTGGGTSGTVTISMPTTGTAGTYAYPVSLTTDAQGRVTAVTAGSAPEVGLTASNGVVRVVNDFRLNPIGAFSVLGSAGGGTPSVISAGDDGDILRRSGATFGFGKLTAGGVAGTQTNGFVVSLVGGVPTWSAASSSSFYQTLKANGTPATQRSAINFSAIFGLTDSSGSDHTTVDVATNSLPLNRLPQISAHSILGNFTNATGNVTSIGGGSAGSVLRNDGTNLTWSSLTGGIMLGFTNNQVVVGQASGGGIQSLPAGTNGHVLTMVSGAPAWAAPSGGGGGTIDGSGAATRLAIWSDADTLTSDAGLTLASNLLTHTASSSGGTVADLVENTSSGASSHATQRVKVTSTTGDPMHEWITAATTWAAGIDNDGLTYDTDPWILARGGTPKVTATADYVYFGGSGTVLGYNGANRIHADTTTGVAGATLFAGAAGGSTEQTALSLVHRSSSSVNANIAVEFFPAGGINGGVVGSGEAKIVSRYVGAGSQQLAMAVKNPSNVYVDRFVLYSNAAPTYIDGTGATVTL